MSKLKNDKIENKQRIKETILGLILTISIGVAGSVGSYAYFSDRVNADNGIVITMGTLDVGISDGFNQNEFEVYDKTKPQTVYTKEFTITNNGTLDEILTLKFDNVLFNGSVDKENLGKVNYKLVINGEKEIECNLAELSTKGVDLGRLNSGESISCTATLINNGIEQSYEKDTVITFNLVVDGIQINYESVKNGGAN